LVQETIWWSLLVRLCSVGLNLRIPYFRIWNKSKSKLLITNLYKSRLEETKLALDLQYTNVEHKSRIALCPSTIKKKMQTSKAEVLTNTNNKYKV
jgi:hypothetical protein